MEKRLAAKSWWLSRPLHHGCVLLACSISCYRQGNDSWEERNVSRVSSFYDEKTTPVSIKLEGNVLRYLRPTKSEMLTGKNFQMFFCYVQISIISKCPWCPRCPNVHDVQMSMMSKCPWCPNVHDIQMSMMSKFPLCPNVHDVQMSTMSECPCRS